MTLLTALLGCMIVEEIATRAPESVPAGVGELFASVVGLIRVQFVGGGGSGLSAIVGERQLTRKASHG